MPSSPALSAAPRILVRDGDSWTDAITGDRFNAPSDQDRTVSAEWHAAALAYIREHKANFPDLDVADVLAADPMQSLGR